MINRFITYLFFTGIFISKSYAQLTSADIKIISAFLPANYSVLKFAKGDLNNDTITDLILVLNREGEDSLSSAASPVKRKLLLLTGQQDRSYKLVAQNENVIYYYNYDPNFKDAFVDLNIKKGAFTIDHYGGFAQRWGRTLVFKYNAIDKKWYLIKDDYSTFEATNVDKTTKEKVLTAKDFGKIAFEQFDIYKQRK